MSTRERYIQAGIIRPSEYAFYGPTRPYMSADAVDRTRATLIAKGVIKPRQNRVIPANWQRRDIH